MKGGGLDAGERFDLFGGLSLGRSPDADIRIDDRFASGIHARRLLPIGRVLRRGHELDQRHPLNGGQLTGEAQLSDLDEIRIGDTEFRFELEMELSRMLRIVEQAHRTDTGRQRDANEDSYFAGAPVFAVADGMGGAQAGEVASRIAAEAFEPGERGDEAPRRRSCARSRSTRTARSTSSRRRTRRAPGWAPPSPPRWSRATRSASATSATAAPTCFRDGELKRLTKDHSLVEELRRQGRLTEEQAEEHPQRSIITRALGPRAEVEVDTMTYRAKPGDVFLLCSDGLTTMVKDDEIAAILARAASLEEAASQADRRRPTPAGGRDNITVVLFRVGRGRAVAGRGAARR